MFTPELVLKKRTEIVHALSSSGSAEHLERILDILLAQGVLAWEEYQSIQVQGRTLYTNARQLLDLIQTKGADTCGVFLTAVKQVIPGDQGADIFSEEERGVSHKTVTCALLTQRPGLVNELQGCIEGALKTLVDSGHFTSTEWNEVQLPIYTPSQKARCLIDQVRSKGEAATKVLLQYLQQRHACGYTHNQEKWTPPQEFLRYQKKLSSTVSAQSCFLSSYGGMSHMPLDDIYTESQLELAHDSVGVHSPLDIEDIVGSLGTVNEEADTVLVSGEAGSGKSTLLQRLHWLWSRGAALQDILLLFPFSCRRLNSEQRELSVHELLFHHCCWPDREQENIFQVIQDHPDLILCTFDGLDELKQSFSDELHLCCPTERAPVSVILFNLLQGSLLKGVRKVVTSRPEAVGPVLKKHFRKEILLKGFSPSGIECFVRKHHSDSVVAGKVLESLQTNTALLGLCHTPVLCWIVSQCHKELLGCGGGSPQTITDVYLMILQHFFQHQDSPKSTATESWLQKNLKTILHLGQLAFGGISTSCYIFSNEDLETCGVTMKDIAIGFLIHTKDMSSAFSRRYEFLHVTVQCFFAALYIVLSNDTDRWTIPKLFQSQEVKESGRRTACFKCLPSSDNQQVLEKETKMTERLNLQITATFVSGLLSQQHQNLQLHCCSSVTFDKKVRQVMKCLSKGMQKHFKSIPQPVPGEKKSMHAMPSFVWLIKCIYELQESELAKDAMQKLQVDHLKLTYCNIGPVECTALAYVLQHLSNPIGLQLDYNSIGDVGVEQLLPCMQKCHALYLRNNSITDEGICKLISKVIHCENLQKIALFNNKLTDACTHHLSHLLKTKQNFCSLRIGNNNITAEGACRLAEGLKFNRSLQYLGLWGNKIGDAGAEALASALENSNTLVWLRKLSHMYILWQKNLMLMFYALTVWLVMA
ncbi:nucleotide-binding oligomerization domain-containing protein 2 isoform X2 [Thalassophryne amazonica]|uniref:nucleotide-binding oligomerization domain-containing protein 2 isoform X2 n=1 Tax=Thalassophryne amazonica TaxID=390379 RepID=UPI001471BBB0|nr:nucleotide-binding oligomerization domain-containing protein 2 isoform X2 [Thalassophryne amazonica]